MKREQLSDALNLMYDDLVKEAGQQRLKYKSPRRRFLGWLLKRVGLLIFTLAAAILIVSLLVPESVYPVKNMRGEPITAWSITEYTGAPLFGCSPYAYDVVHASDIQEAMFSPVQGTQDIEALHAYTPTDVAGTAGYIERCSGLLVNGLKLAFGSEGTITQDERNEHLWHVSMGGSEVMTARYSFDNTTGRVNSRFIFNSVGDGPLPDISLPVDADDSEAITAGWAATDLLNSILGTSCTPQKVTRSTSEDGSKYIYIRAWETDGDLQEQLYSACISYIDITFTNSGLSQDSDLRFYSAFYSIEELEQVYDEPLPLLSLAEAEEELEKGYIFRGHICRICRSSVLPVDFSDYDGVEVIYHDIIHPHNIPYYAFYKYIGDDTFAVTYVPAVHVEDLDEYFKVAEKLHETQ